MNRRERRQQKKKKERQERLRRELHARQAPDRKGVRLKKPEPNDEANRAAAPPTAPSTEGKDTYPPADVPLDDFFRGEPARKWLGALVAGSDLSPIVYALELAEDVPSELLLKASVCCEILVAAELVAARRGRPSRHLPTAAAAWLFERDIDFSPGVVAMAAAAVRRVGQFSELRHLWDAVRLAPEWLCGVEALIARLQSGP